MKGNEKILGHREADEKLNFEKRATYDIFLRDVACLNKQTRRRSSANLFVILHLG